jgi:NAD+ synthetase
VIGLSGGIDSSLVAAIAVDALGSSNVLGVSMPSPYTSDASVKYAEELSKNLGIDLMTIPIDGIYRAYKSALKGHANLTKKVSLTDQNIQARIRGNILMSISNSFGHIVLSTGNKSELATGYCTLYGDMSGGLAVISDVPKTLVYKLAAYINKKRTVIPDGVIRRAPSAELRPGQKDQDTLPPYEVLDRVLYNYIDSGMSESEIVKKGLDRKTVRWVIDAVRKNEYKRKQAAPGLKVTTKSFGSGRRLPVAAKYVE